MLLWRDVTKPEGAKAVIETTEAPKIKYKVNRKNYEDREVSAHTVLFERTHVVFIEVTGQVICAFRAEDVISVIRIPSEVRDAS